MKKLVLIMVGGLLLGSCGSETTETTDEPTEGTTETQTASSGDIVKDQILALIADVEKGMKPLSPIADITNYDNEAQAYLVGEKETGNFNASWEIGDFQGSRFYSKKYNNESQLGEVRLSIFVNEEVYYNYDTDEEDESKKIDYDKYLTIITEEVGVPAEEEDYTGGGHVWRAPTANWYLSSYDDYSLELRMKEPE